MCKKIFILVVIIVIFAIIGHFYFKNYLLEHCDKEKCPYCYGQSMCNEFEENNISLTLSSFFNIMTNLFNTKNVYYGEYNNMDVVIKKLSSDLQLNRLDMKICKMLNESEICNITNLHDDSNYDEKVVKYLIDPINELKPFRVCSNKAAEFLFKFFLSLKGDDVDTNEFMKNVWTILQINVEPLLLQMLNYMEIVPKYLGSCGRFIVEEHSGSPLTEMVDAAWTVRAYLAYQVLETAKNLTFDHPNLIFYLTDVSPDNIVVDDNNKLTFVDLEHVIVLDKQNTSTSYHQSDVNNEMDDYAFSVDDLCNNSLSDHNYYSVCKFLLSKNAPWPMMKNGLLHSAPVYVIRKHPELFTLVEKCAVPKSDDRIKIGQTIMDILNIILDENHG